MPLLWFWRWSRRSGATLSLMTQSFLRGLRLEKWCSSWHIRSCTCWGHTRTRDMSCVVETGLLEMNGCALVAAISQSSCHPLFCPVSGKYIYSLLFFCVYRQIYIFPSLFLCIPCKTCKRNIFLFARWRHRPKISDVKNIGCAFLTLRWILPDEEIWVSVGEFHHQLLPIRVYQRQRCPDRLHPSKLPSCQLFHEIHYIFPVSILVVTNSSSEFFAGCWVPSATHFWSYSSQRQN